VHEPEGYDESATGCVVELLRTGSVVNARLAGALRPHGLTEASFNVLMILEGSDRALCPHEIGERRLVTRGTVTGVLDSLERHDLIRRSPHPADRRMLLIELTPAGRDLLAKALPDVRRAEADVMDGLSTTERDTLQRLLRKAGTIV
jgi:DNA-binding MarR family transcriptional regulator